MLTSQLAKSHCQHLRSLPLHHACTRALAIGDVDREARGITFVLGAMEIKV